MTAPAVFLDRDGTLNRENDFVTREAELDVFPTARDALARLRAAGFRLIVVTNQSGIARGLYDEATLARIHARMHTELGAAPHAYLHCPHHPDQTGPYGRRCSCRKPGTGLIENAARLLGLDLTRSFVVGDSARDVIAGATLPLRSVLVRSGKPWRAAIAALRADGYTPDHVCDDIRGAAEWILAQSGV